MIRIKKISIILCYFYISLLIVGCLPKPKPKYIGHRRTKAGAENKTEPQKSDVSENSAPDSATVFIDEIEDSGDFGASAEDAPVTEASDPQNYSLSTNTLTSRLAEALLPFVRSPYKFGGEETSGVDCSGLVKVVYENAFDIQLPHKAALQYRMGKKISKKQLMAGDLVFFYQKNRRVINHVGLYLADDQFIHAISSRGVAISDLNRDYWRKHYAGARRFLARE